MKAKLTLNNLMLQATSRRKKLDQAVQESAAELESKIKQKMLPSTRKDQVAGKTYKRRSVVHRASAPGQAPAVDTGGLVNSIRAKPAGEMKATVSTNKKYAAPLDQGAKAPAMRRGRRPKGFTGPVRNLMGPQRGGIAARPFFESTAEEFRPKFKENISKVIKSGG